MTTQELVEFLVKRLDRQDAMLTGLDTKLESHIRDEANIRPALVEMAEMWGRSKAVAWFFTKLATMIAIVAGGWSWAKEHLK
jgi:hypothetical protein